MGGRPHRHRWNAKALTPFLPSVRRRRLGDGEQGQQLSEKLDAMARGARRRALAWTRVKGRAWIRHFNDRYESLLHDIAEARGLIGGAFMRLALRSEISRGLFSWSEGEVVLRCGVGKLCFCKSLPGWPPDRRRGGSGRRHRTSKFEFELERCRR